jgi:hypothetical protein
MIRKRFHKQEYVIPSIGETKPIITLGGRDKSTRKRFVPNINMSFRSGEAEQFYVNVNDPEIVVENETPSITDGIEVSVNGRSNRFYEQDNGLEHEITLSSKPDSRKVILDIKHSSEIIFEELPTLDKDGEQRSEELINSYVAYHEIKSGTGIATEIKKPMAIPGRMRFLTRTSGHYRSQPQSYKT